jgi:LPXTG-site transpeptidase (sortase) family protein
MEFKKLLPVFILLFLTFSLIINWNKVSWVFNYRAVSGVFSDFFQTDFFKKEAKPADYYEKENGVEIPKIGISAPLISVEAGGNVEKSLDSGTVHFPDSASPGEAGQTVILGHSAPAGWPEIKYDWVFSRLAELAEGDEIIVYFNHEKFNYFVDRKIFLERGEEIPQNLTNSENSLILISCWPPGKDIKRIAVVASQ